MLAAYAVRLDGERPLDGLEIGERPEPVPPPGWSLVQVRAAAVNHHDLWSLRGVGLPADRLPMILGCDAAGVDEDGRHVIVHGVISTPDRLGDETLDPQRSLLSERYDGTFAERVAVPSRNLVPMPEWLSYDQAACLPTAWLTAYRMLFTQAEVRPGDTVLVQGAVGGVSSALVLLGKAAGLRIWVTSRSEGNRRRALDELGADGAYEPGARLPERVDAVMETVGAATWSHSLRALRPGGTLVCAGATSGPNPPADLSRIFFLQLRIHGTTMGTRAELESLLGLLEVSGVRPRIDRMLPLERARDGLAALESGAVFGKVVLHP